MEPASQVQPSAAALEKLLEENLALTKENHRLLRRQIQIGRIAFWFKIVIWALVLGLPVLFLGPLTSMVRNSVSSPSFLGIPSGDTLRNAVDHYRTGTTSAAR